MDAVVHVVLDRPDFEDMNDRDQAANDLARHFTKILFNILQTRYST